MTTLSLEQILHTLARAQAAGLSENTGAGWRLTAEGRELAVLIMRAHRLIETRLARESSVPAGAWHDIAHVSEHRLTRDDVNHLADRLGNPRFDPHGDPIPTREGQLPEREGKSLLAWEAGSAGVIAHIEDEPPALFAQLADAGVFAGMRLTLRTTSSRGCDLVIEGKNVLLPLELAALVRVRALYPNETATPANACRLSDIPAGGGAQVLGLLAGCAGAERSRLLDLGFVPGSRIEPTLQSPFDGPVAYRVRGTMIALRRDQADQVLVQPN
jgi:DtxR family Mn-dependent transcriptional regulator